MSLPEATEPACAGGRPPLLLLPGLLCDARLWHAQIGQLAGLCRRVEVADLTQQATIDDMAAAVLAVAPPRFVAAGLSMGGIVLFEMLRQSPERVIAAGLLNTTAAPESADRRAERSRQFARTARGEFDAMVREELKPAYPGACHRDDPALLETVMAMARDLGEAVFERQCRALADRPDSRPLLCQLRCPTEIVGGDQDQLCPPDGHRAMAAAIPDARLTLLSACGHLSPLERPQAVSAVLARLLERAGAAEDHRKGNAHENQH